MPLFVDYSAPAIPSPEASYGIKAIPTTYKAVPFRSRLEARWAVFLDSLAVDWRYEHHPFLLAPTGEGYLPDFYLPEYSSWIEVKPPYPNRDAQRKVCLFTCGLAHDPARSHERAYILYGDIPWPYPKKGNILGFRPNWADGESPTITGLCWQVCPICDQLMIGSINEMQCLGCMPELDVLLDDALKKVPSISDYARVVEIVPAMLAAGGDTNFFRGGHRNLKLREAYAAARSARFDRRRRPTKVVAKKNVSN